MITSGTVADADRNEMERTNRRKIMSDEDSSFTVNWFAVAGVVIGAVVANLLPWGIASINGMFVAALVYSSKYLICKGKGLPNLLME